MQGFRVFGFRIQLDANYFGPFHSHDDLWLAVLSALLAVGRFFERKAS